MALFARKGPKQEAEPEPGRPTVVGKPVVSGVQPVEDGTVAPPDPFAELKLRIHERLIKEMDLSRINGSDREAVRPQVEEAAGVLLAGQDTPLSRQERQRLMREIADEILGLGPIEPLIKDPTITEVMVNRYNQVYFERGGLLYLSPVSFRDDAHIMRIIEKIIGPLGRRVDESSPMVDARLPDGSRVNAIIPPLAVDGPALTIRKFSRDPFTVDDLISFGTLTAEMAQFFKACVETRLNIIISGGTGTGKTTFLNVLSSFLPSRERIVTIEDPCELQLRQPNVVRLETRPPNIENKGEVTQRQLVRNTGHDGSLTTVHANSPRDALARVENMVMMANLDLPVRAIREQVASAINLIIHLSRMRDGVRRVVQVSEIAGMEGEMITLQDIFVFRQTGVDQDGRVLGRMTGTGLRPRFADRFVQHGIHLPPDIFAPRREGDR